MQCSIQASSCKAVEKTPKKETAPPRPALPNVETGKLDEWGLGKCEKFGECLAPMAKVANIIEKHLEGILAH